MLITDFYANREIFITGGTGFLGKAQIDKLLRSCPNVGRIYLLLRPKKGKCIDERLDELSKEMVFERLHKEQPNLFKEKLRAISGDCCELGLGISNEDLDKLKNVSIIFHGAANVRFDNCLANSTLMNVRGTWELVKIAETLQKLVAFIHVSTAYVNANDISVQKREEKIVKIATNWRTTIKLAETVNEDVLDILSLKYSDYFPNPYSFTKTLSEQIIEEYSDRIPMLIFRPSIVVSALREPVPGWLDNFNGPIGLLTAIAVGITRYKYADFNVHLSLVAIDAVTRMTIVSAYKRGLETLRYLKPSSPSTHLEVINCCGDPFWTLNIYQCAVMMCKYHQKEPFVNTLWAPSLKFTKNYYWFILHVLLFDVPLCTVYDILLRLNKRKPMTMNLLRRMIFTSKTLYKFSNNQFKFKMDNLFNLNEMIPESEIDEFSLKGYLPHDMDAMFYYVIRGIKQFLLKEDLISSPKSQWRYKTFLVVDKILTFTFYSVLLRILWSVTN